MVTMQAKMDSGSQPNHRPSTDRYLSCRKCFLVVQGAKFSMKREFVLAFENAF